MNPKFQSWNDRFPVEKPTSLLLLAMLTLSVNVGCQSAGTGLLSKGIFRNESQVDLNNYPPPSSVQTPVALSPQNGSLNGPANAGLTAPANQNAIASALPSSSAIGTGTATLATGNNSNTITSPIGSVTIPASPVSGQAVASNYDPGTTNPVQGNYEYAQQGYYSDPDPVRERAATPASSLAAASALPNNVPPPAAQIAAPPVATNATTKATPYTVPDTPLNAPTALPVASNTRNSSFEAATSETSPAPTQLAATNDSIYGSVSAPPTAPTSTMPEPATPETIPPPFPVAQAIAYEPVNSTAPIAPSAYEAAATAKSASSSWRPGSTSSLKK